MLRPIDKLSSESFVGVAALLLWTESEHGKLFESVVVIEKEQNEEKQNGLIVRFVKKKNKKSKDNSY